MQKHYADSIASRHQIPILWIDQNGKVAELQRYEHGIPVYYQTENKNAAATISSNLTWEENGFSPGLSGNNMIAGIWDAGYVLQNHQEFLVNNISRVFQHDVPSFLGAHASHLSGTMIAAGVNSLSKGMAGKGIIYAYDYNNDLAEMASEAADGLQVSNHSYGPMSGWSYNSSDEMWYWYGDVDVSTTEDLKFGLYTETSRDLDFIAYHAPEYLIVKSAGNDRNDSPANQPLEHYIWDENWTISTLQHQPDGGTNGYECLSPMAIAKNILTVGAVEDLPNGYTTASEVHITLFSSWGPTDDGRIKPDIVANGMTILSCSSEDNKYIELSGTSMSAASISGSVLLLNELQEMLQPGVKLRSSSLKALIIHTADESGPSPGPDFQHGWGLANFFMAATLLKTNHAGGGKQMIDGILNQGETVNIPIIIPSNTSAFKATICWTDPPGEIAPYVLNGPGSNLVNNLDIKVIQASTQQNHHPWILSPSNPALAASKGVNNYDNVEQVFIDAPVAGAYTLSISHQNNLENGQQAFSLILSGIASGEALYPPENLTYVTGDRVVNLLWQQGLSTSANSYNIYRNGIINGTSTGLQFIDQAVENGVNYSYYVTAVYSSGQESIPTNTIIAKPIIPKSMPYTMDCESGLEDWQVKAEISGWRLGDSDSLSCYYLNFSNNTSQFLGIDSYTAGPGIHVHDVAISPPIDLVNFEDITLSFDYMLVTGLYGTTNEVHAMYRLNQASAWILIANLPGALNWKNVQFTLPPEAAVSGCQLGFFYDDYYKQGMGAGLDNIQLTGTLNVQEDISLQSIDAPISELCVQENSLDLAVTIKNTGNTTVLSGAIVTITTLCNGIQKERNYTLTQDLTAGSSKSITFPLFINPLPAGTHVLTVDISWIKDQNLSNNSKSKDILINALPEISFTDAPQIICEDGDPVEFLAVPAGGTFEGTYITGNSFDPAAAGLGEHEITYTFTDANNCTTSGSITIEVVALPEVSFSGLSESYCIDNPSVNLTGIPSGGTFSGPGISNTTFSPGVAGAGTHLIQYAYEDENGCMNFKELQTTVYDLTPISFTNLADNYCQNEKTIQLSALPAGGTFYVNDQIGSYLYPDQYPPGNVEISYIFQNEHGCITSLTKNITILAPPDVTITDPGIPLCLMDTNITLTGVPTEGIFIGNLIEENTFNPEDAGIGQHEIIYKFTDANNCTNADSLTLTVVPLPEVSFSGLSAQYCVHDEKAILNGIPSGGIFSGPGIIDNSFVPEQAGAGIHQIQYTYTDMNGCANLDLELTTVYDLTPLIFTNLQESYCQNGSPVELSAIPAGGTFSIDGEIVNYLDPGVYPLGSIEVQYSYQNGYGCESTLTQQVVIETLPKVSITDPGDPFCLIDMDIKLDGQPIGGTFTGSVVKENIFNPIHSGIGSHEIIYTYNDGNGCQNADTIVIKVVSLPEVSFTGLSEKYCVNEASSQLAGIPFGGIFSGVGIEGNSFNPDVAGIGEAQITYLFTDENGCSNNNIQSTTVVGLTKVSLLNLSDFYCQNDDPVGLSAAPEGGVFFVNALENNVLDPQEVGAGDVEISYVYVDENGCMSMDQEIIGILSIPEVWIEGFSEMYCMVNQDYVLKGSPAGGDFKLEGETITHFNPIELGIGNYELFYEYTDYEGCVGSTSQSFFITSNPTVSIEGLASHYCPNGESMIIEGVPSGGIFEGPGMNDHVFSPKSLLPGSYEITYTYNQNGCFETASATTSITDPVEVIISGLNPEYCPSDSLKGAIGIPEGGLFSTKPVFEEASAGSTTYNLYYTYTDVNNCAFADSGRFEVFSKPDFTTPNQLEVSETDTLTLELQDTDLAYYWTNDSTSKTISIIGNQFEMGENILPVTILDENGCLNIFEVVFSVKGITSTTDEEMIDEIILYPNPARNYLNIQLATDAPNSVWTITIFDLNGKWTSHWEKMKFFDRKLLLDVSNLLPGFYFISISGVNQHFTEKFNVIR